MKLTFNSLLLKIFLWFWMTIIVTGAALLLTFVLEPRGVPSQWHSILAATANYSGTTAIEVLEKDGVPAASTYLNQINHDTQLKACLFELSGQVIAGSGCTSFQTMAANVTNSKNSDFGFKFGLARVAMILRGKSGRAYIFATELPAGPRAALGFNRREFAMQWGVAFLVSGFVCYLLTRYLTAPILHLRQAAQELAAGKLGTRAGSTTSQRKDELGELIADFDVMAARLEDLVSRQRQLISDISHELRSPLARLNVALDLGRQRKGNDPAFDQMEQDMALLNEMIGRLLTIAKLDVSVREVPMVRIEIGGLVSQVVRDANFESTATGDAVRFSADGPHFVVGNAELLHSAIENVVRNAIHYTDTGTAVEIQLEDSRCENGSLARIAVRDHGPGVPASELANIFRPFYRVADARDRKSGGAGLGLAITERVVRAHGGTVHAENAPCRGLVIEILLPEDSVSQD